MKCGVRRTPEELARARKVYSTKVVSGHAPTPRKSEPNSVIDHQSNDGTIDVRTFYDGSGKKQKDIHTTNHGNPKQHAFGEHGEHVVEYEWNEDMSIKNKSRRNLTDKERKENSDIL